MQYFMLVKIGVTLLLGVGTVRVALEALEHSAVPLLNAAKWVIIGLLLALFTAFILQIVALTRRVHSRTPDTIPIDAAKRLSSTDCLHALEASL